MLRLNDIARNLAAVRQSIARAAERAGRDPGGIELVAVSKGRSLEAVFEAARAGQKAFGENRAQEFRDKVEGAAGDLEWHFIGTLQRNKVNMVVGKAALIHSLDSERLAAAVDRRARELGTVQPVLIQVNVSGEESKHGVGMEGVVRLLEAALELPGLEVRGLMTIAPLLDSAEEARPYFRRMADVRCALLRGYPPAALEFLSMGMTQDFEVAVEEGANMVRVGTAIFS